MSQVRADNITNRQGTGAPLFVNGIRVTGLTSISNMVAGIATFTSDVSIGGTLTYEDVTNIDSVGIVTARSGVRVTAGGVVVTAGVSTFADDIKLNIDSKKIYLGAGADLELFHNGTNSHVRNQTGDLILDCNNGGSSKLRAKIGEEGVVVVADGEVSLWHDGSKKFETTSGGVKITGNQVSAVTAMGANSVNCSLGNFFSKTITGATTLTFDSVPTGVEYSFTLEVTLNGSNAITWPTSVKWNADTAPAITDGKTQLFMFLTTNGGTRWRGSALVDYVN